MEFIQYYASRQVKEDDIIIYCKSQGDGEVLYHFEG